jgi:hypothetical protein
MLLVANLKYGCKPTLKIIIRKTLVALTYNNLQLSINVCSRLLHFCQLVVIGSSIAYKIFIIFHVQFINAYKMITPTS